LETPLSKSESASWLIGIILLPNPIIFPTFDTCTFSVADVSGVSTETVSRKIKEMYPDRVKNGKSTRLIQLEALSVMSELRKKNFVVPLQNDKVPLQNDKVCSILSERDIAIISQIVSVTVSETIKALDGRMSNLENKIEQRQALLPAPQIDPRTHIVKLVTDHVSKTGQEFRDVYNTLYREYGYRTHCNASLSAKNRNMKIIDYIDSEGQIEILESIAMEIFK